MGSRSGISVRNFASSRRNRRAPRRILAQETRGGQPRASDSVRTTYSTASTSARQLASMMFSLTPTVPNVCCPKRCSMSTSTFDAVPSLELTTYAVVRELQGGEDGKRLGVSACDQGVVQRVDRPLAFRGGETLSRREP